MLRKFAADYKADGVVADAMRDAADEIDRLNQWADSMTDSVLKERALADALIKELRAKEIKFCPACDKEWSATRSESERITGWIPTSERQPPCANNYLSVGKWSDGDQSVHERYFSMAGKWEGGSHVTHWMPLPEAPK